MQPIKIYITLWLMLMPVACALAETIPAVAALVESTPADTASVVAESRPGLVKRILNYFGNANKGKDPSRLDFSIIGGPYYTSDIGVGLGLVASGLYGTGVVDSVIPPSNVGLFGKISTKGFASVGIEGTHISPTDSYRITYLTAFFADPSDYWGIGYRMGNDDANESSMKRMGFKATGAMLFHVGANLYIGPMIAVDYIHAYEIGRRELLDGMRSTTWSYGAGMTLSYDSRDVLTNPHRGIYASVTQCFRPKFIGNRYAFSSTAIQFDAYRTLWQGAILACDVRAEFNYGHPSWHMMAKTGGTHFMRGYYEGRYRDKHMMAAQMELRQHVWRRNGVVAWFGAATVFSRPSDVMLRRMLPNAGVGYRWEFKKDVNVRFDIGFGKSGQSGFMFGINEAF